MDVIDIQRKAKDDAKKMVLIFNPLRTDFSFTYGGVTEVFPMQENMSLPFQKAQFVATLLIDAYLLTKSKDFSRDAARKLVFND